MRPVRKAAAVLAVVALLVGCSGSDDHRGPWGTQQAAIGESQAILGWNVSSDA